MVITHKTADETLYVDAGVMKKAATLYAGAQKGPDGKVGVHAGISYQMGAQIGSQKNIR